DYRFVARDRTSQYVVMVARRPRHSARRPLRWALRHNTSRYPVNELYNAEFGTEPTEQQNEAAMTQFNTATADAPISPQSLSTRLIAGVSVSDTPLVTAVVEYAQRLSEPYLFNHAMRSWLFAEAMGRIKGINYDREVVAIGTVLHDIGLTTSVSGPNRFEVNGADAALSFIRGKGLSDRRAQLIWDLVALNSTPSLALHKEPEVAVGTMGIGLDYGGFGIEAIPTADVERVLSAFPR